MTDETHQPSPQQDNLPTPPVFASPPVQPRKSNGSTWLIIGGVIAALCLCSILCAAVFGTGIYKVYTEKAPIESVLDAYMRHMANKDADSAYALFSPRAQRQIPISKLQEMLVGNNYFLFEGYQSLSLSNLHISAAGNTNPDQPQGIVAEVTGVINFEGGIQGSFDGTLEKVGDKWMIDGMFVTVPPNKIKP